MQRPLDHPYSFPPRSHGFVSNLFFSPLISPKTKLNNSSRSNVLVYLIQRLDPEARIQDGDPNI